MFAGVRRLKLSNGTSPALEIKNAFDQHNKGNYTCDNCGKGYIHPNNGNGLGMVKKSHNHSISGEHYVCSTHDYVGTSQLH